MTTSTKSNESSNTSLGKTRGSLTYDQLLEWNKELRARVEELRAQVETLQILLKEAQRG